MLGTLDFQERLRDAARGRHAASAHVEMHPAVMVSAPEQRVAAALFGGWRTG